MKTDAKNEGFAKRLKDRMKSQRLRIVDLSEMSGISYEMIRRYTAGIARPREDNVAALAEILQTTASYLDYGIEAEQTPVATSVAERIANTIELQTSVSNGITRYPAISDIDAKALRYVPVLSLIEAQKIHKTDKDGVADSFEPALGSLYSANVYWVRIEDDSMYPEFKRGDLVLIDPELKAMPSDFVLACIDSADGLVLRKWRPRGYDEATGQPYEQLLAEHEDYPITDNRHTSFDICGVAIEKKQRLK